VQGDSEHQEQAPPVPNESTAVQQLVRDDLVERQRIGTERYGTPLQAFNGRDALRDAYEEALDLACYLRQAIEERGAPAKFWRDRDGDVWTVRDDGLLWQGEDASGGYKLDDVQRQWGPLTKVGKP
jgi:hypothetical protein